MALSGKARERHLELMQSYVAALPEKIFEIKKSWREARDEQWRGNASRELYRLVHQLAGSGTVFGFPEITEAARRAADCLSALNRARNIAETDSIAESDKLLEQLCLVLGKCTEAQPNSSLEIAPSVQAVEPPVGTEPEIQDILYLVEDDQKQASLLRQHLSAYGYSAEVFNDLEAFSTAVRTVRPKAVIMDIVFPEGVNAGIEVVNKINADLEDPIPIVFISIRGDLQVRIDALHAGAAAYLTKPFKPSELIDRLESIVRPQYFEPYRILVVDDDKALAAYYCKILREAKMETAIVNDPLQIMEPLVNFRPDLLLMDFTMPGCTGLDLAAALRQEDAYARLPIIFISQEVDPEKRLACIGVGADDYLTKPVDEYYLVRLVASRVQRGRKLHKIIARDSLTGLLNHNAFMDRFEEVRALLAREKGRLALAMIDLDKFKWINDVYGHVAGDIALKNVSELLMRRLRGTDVLGRYAGDVFAVLLVDADLEGARSRLDVLRRETLSMPHRIADCSFNITFSAGVTSYDVNAAPDSPIPDVNRLIRYADQALYRAKKNGRNQVQTENFGESG
jgi:diguanylate cyclase (GGDEF)-like protein